MEKMQEFIDFIFYEVWCKAPGNGTFSLDLFDNNPELKDVMANLFYDHTEGGDFFYGHIEDIHGLFATLTQAQIDQFKQWYQANNDIEKACANDPELVLARYDEIEPLHRELGKQLAAFFKKLYWDKLLDLAALRRKIGDIDDHYRNFMQTNTTGRCPFCGIGDVKGVYHTKREAYDHYLPKGVYPFNSINFRNLAPACHECNSAYKLGKDPVNTATGRRKAFYPYADLGHNIDIRIDLKKADVDHLTPDDIELECGPAALNEEIETWKEVYGIEERYKAKCCGENDGKYWLVAVFDEWQEGGRSPTEYLNALARQTAKSPFADSNFLRKAFLEGCSRVGLF
jgi:hypothetical protein